MSDNTLTKHAQGGVTLSQERLDICLESVYELEALAQILPGLVPNAAESGPAHYAVRALADRIRRLSCTVLSSLDDDLHPLGDLEHTVFGCVRKAAA